MMSVTLPIPLNQEEMDSGCLLISLGQVFRQVLCFFGTEGCNVRSPFRRLLTIYLG